MPSAAFIIKTKTMDLRTVLNEMAPLFAVCDQFGHGRAP